jgi:hypothetical protein
VPVCIDTGLHISNVRLNHHCTCTVYLWEFHSWDDGTQITSPMLCNRAKIRRVLSMQLACSDIPALTVLILLGTDSHVCWGPCRGWVGCHAGGKVHRIGKGGKKGSWRGRHKTQSVFHSRVWSIWLCQMFTIASGSNSLRIHCPLTGWL